MSERARYWAGLLAEWERSGLTQAEFCRRRELNAGTWAWWKRQLQGSSNHKPRRRERPVKSSNRFVELRLAGIPSVPTYEVILARGRSIRVPLQFDPEILSRLIAAVESC